MKERRYTPELIISRLFASQSVLMRSEIDAFYISENIDAETVKNIEKQLVPLQVKGEYTCRHIVMQEKSIKDSCAVLTEKTQYSPTDGLIPVAVDRDIVESVCMDFISRAKPGDNSAERARVHAGLMLSSSRLLVLEGAPGTAKSTTALELMKAYGKHRRRYIGENVCDYKGLWVLAMNPFAMEKWRERAGVQGATIEQILTTDEMGVTTIPEGAFVAVDEAGLIGTEKMSLLLRKAVECKWQKLVLMGDVKQDSPEEYGQPLHYLLRNFSGISFELKTPFRQKSEDERMFVGNLYEGKSSEALSYLRCSNRIKFSDRKTIITSVAGSVARWRKKDNNITKQCFILVQNNDIANEVTEALTEIQRNENIVTDCYPYRGTVCEWILGKGDRVMLRQNMSESGKEYGRGSLGTITESSEKTMTVRLDRKDGAAADISVDRNNPYLIAPAYCLLFSHAQGIAADITAVMITEPVNGTALISACSRHRYRCDIYVDSGIYSSENELAEAAGYFPVKRMPYLDGYVLQEENK